VHSKALMREDISSVVGVIIARNPSLSLLFLNTNGTYPRKAETVLKEHARTVPQFYLAVSIDGDRDIHRQIRGIDCYDLAIETIERTVSLGINNVRLLISTTLQEINSNEETMNHIMGLAKRYNADFSFRFVDKSATYYNNVNTKISLPTDQSKLRLLDMGLSQFPHNQFLPVLRETIATGKNKVMTDDLGELVCEAGKLFCFVNFTGDIYPCLYSTRPIGHVLTGITLRDFKLGTYEPCPCVTDCHIYPMMLYSGKKQ